jgi:hypothetical protein
MKKLIAIISLLFVGCLAIAQTPVQDITTNGFVKAGTYSYIWGSTADTLTDADTLNYTLRVKHKENIAENIKIGLYSDFVSGSAGGKLIGYGSLDGVNYFSAGDTITVTSLIADGFDSETLDYTGYMWPYLKLIYIQSGTAVTIPKVYIYSKQ